MARGAGLAAGGGGAAGPGRPRGSRPGPERRPRGARAAPGSPGGDAGESGGRPATKLSAGRRRGWWALAALQLHLLRALAQDDVVPYFKTEPGLPQIHLEGNRLVLTCLAEGSWPLEFKWTHNDSELTTYTSEYKYVIPSLQRLDAGFYRCVVRNRMGALLQRRSEVQVAYMGDFTDADERRVVSEGRAAVLSLPPISSCPRPQVTWFRDGHKIIPSSRIAITLENQLVILAAAASDAGAYYVQAVNERNGENKTSPPVHLSIATREPQQRENRNVSKRRDKTRLFCCAVSAPHRRALFRAVSCEARVLSRVLSAKALGVGEFASVGKTAACYRVWSQEVGPFWPGLHFLGFLDGAGTSPRPLRSIGRLPSCPELLRGHSEASTDHRPVQAGRRRAVGCPLVVPGGGGKLRLSVGPVIVSKQSTQLLPV